MKLFDSLNYERLKIVSINAPYKTKKHLENLGVIKDMNIISLYNYSGDLIIKVKDGLLALDANLASLIEVISLETNRFKLLLTSYKKVFDVSLKIKANIHDINRYEKAIEILKEPEKHKEKYKKKILKLREKNKKLIDEHNSKKVKYIEKDLKLIGNVTELIAKNEKKISKLSLKKNKVTNLNQLSLLSSKILKLKLLNGMYSEIKNLDKDKICQLLWEVKEDENMFDW